MRLMLGDCLERLREIPDVTIDSCVTDPPYGLSFMGKAWDHSVPSVEVWREVFRVLKPGAHLLAFFGTRTYHRGAVAIEDAGFEIRDQIGWCYGSGFPKSLNLADEWQGWGTALKPAWEPIVLARKPMNQTIAANVRQYGTGALNIDGCRVGSGSGEVKTIAMPDIRGAKMHAAAARGKVEREVIDQGRWPANLIHDGSAEVTGMFPETRAVKRNEKSDDRKAPFMQAGGNATAGYSGRRTPENSYTDNGGSAARFFYAAKASKADREDGLELLQMRTLNRVNPGGLENDPRWQPIERKNHHPTVKPTDLMRYLCKLVTPTGGTVIDPFMGSGSTGRGAILEGFDFVGIEIDPDYLAIAEARINAIRPQPSLFRVDDFNMQG